jgi:hypothetical protein
MVMPVANLSDTATTQGSLAEARDLALELSVRLAGVVAAADLLELETGVPEGPRILLSGARTDLVEAAEYLQRLLCVLDVAVGTPTQAAT